MTLLKAIRKSKKPVLVAFESTGSISIYFAEQLDWEGIARACLNPAWIRHHAKSIGQVAKTDCIDSKMIAQYAHRHQIQADTPMSPKVLKMRQLQRYRSILIKHRAQLKATLHTYRDDFGGDIVRSTGLARCRIRHGLVFMLYNMKRFCFLSRTGQLRPDGTK